MRFRFFNTFEPVIPLYRLLLPHLEASGHEAEAWIADRRYRQDGSAAVFRTRTLRSWAPSRDGKPIKPLVHLSYAAGAAASSLLGRGTDVNVFLTQPPLFPAWAPVLKTLRRQAYCIIAMDLYPWVAVEAGVLAPRALSTRLAASVARFAFRRADRVIVIGRCMARRVHEMGVAPERVRLIRNWADVDAIRPVARARNPLRHRHGLGDRFVVMYSGNLGVSHRFQDLLTVADRLRDQDDVLFLFAGGGARLPEVEGEVARRRLDNVRFLPYQPYARLGEALSMGDVHFVSLRRGFEGLVVPSKTYGVLAAGRPVVYQGEAGGEIARMVNEEQVGQVVAPGDVDGLTAAILRMRDDSDWRESTAQRARHTAERQYDSGRALRRYKEVLTGLSGGGEGGGDD